MQHDEETSLYVTPNRIYDPKTGIWLSQDPIMFEGGQTNLYDFVGNDPTNRRDPSGLFATASASPTYPTKFPWISGNKDEGRKWIQGNIRLFPKLGQEGKDYNVLTGIKTDTEKAVQCCDFVGWYLQGGKKETPAGLPPPPNDLAKVAKFLKDNYGLVEYNNGEPDLKEGVAVAVFTKPNSSTILHFSVRTPEGKWLHKFATGPIVETSSLNPVAEGAYGNPTAFFVLPKK